MERIARFHFIYSLLFRGRFLGMAILGFFLFPVLAFAESPTPIQNSIDTSFGIANYLPISDTNVYDGDLVSFSPGGYFLSKTPYDPYVIGVVNNNPAISLEVSTQHKTYPVITSGNVLVNVTTSNGNIKKGDSITTSSMTGTGMRATRTGYIIGTSLEDYSSSNTKAIKKISVTLNIHYSAIQSNVPIGLFDVLNLSTLATYQEPIQAFKYFIAAVVIIFSFIFAFFSFARTANKGLEAIGRNPLASRMIQIGIIINILVAVVIIFIGLLVAFVMIRL